MGYYIGVDGGGTFTDCAAMDEQGRLYYAKAATTKDDFAVGMFEALSVLADGVRHDVPELIASTERFSLGTTVGTNLLVERRGARTGLLATAGHGDAILIMRGTGRTAGLELECSSIPRPPHKPVPLVPRALIKEIDERVDCMGEEVVPAGRGGGRGGRPQPGGRARGHGYRHRLPLVVQEPGPRAAGAGDHPRGRSRRLRVLLPPGGAAHGRVRAHGGHGHQQLHRPRLGSLLSAGGRPAARRRAEASLAHHAGVGRRAAGREGRGDSAHLSGLRARSAGIIGSLSLARQLGHKNIIATDMGGTSFEVGLIIGGEPLVGDEKIIDQYRYRLPQLQTTSIACGGGSLARVDPHSRSIRVGPESAGADPGPVCYRRGGTEPTVTDADLVLGLALRGELPGWAHASRLRARLSRPSPALGEKVGLEPEETAAGIVKHQQRPGGGAHPAADSGTGLRPPGLPRLCLWRRRPASRLRLRQGTGGERCPRAPGKRGLHPLRLRLLDVQPGAQHREGAELPSRRSRRTN